MSISNIEAASDEHTIDIAIRITAKIIDVIEKSECPLTDEEIIEKAKNILYTRPGECEFIDQIEGQENWTIRVVRVFWPVIGKNLSEEDAIRKIMSLNYATLYRDKPSNISGRDWLELHRLRFLENPELFDSDMKPVYFTDDQKRDLNKQFLELSEDIKRKGNAESVPGASYKLLTPEQQAHLLIVLKLRSEYAPLDVNWVKLQAKLEANPEKMWSLYSMEITGGAPSPVAYDKDKDEYTFFDCSLYSPAGRENHCYDRTGQEYAKREGEVRAGNAVDAAAGMGIEILTVMDYLYLYDYVKRGKWYAYSEFGKDDEFWLKDEYTGTVDNYDRVSFYKTDNSTAGLSFRGKLDV